METQTEQSCGIYLSCLVCHLIAIDCMQIPYIAWKLKLPSQQNDSLKLPSAWYSLENMQSISRRVSIIHQNKISPLYIYNEVQMHVRVGEFLHSNERITSLVT